MASGISEILRRNARRAIITGGLEASWMLSRAGFGRSARGHGVIFTLHHVRPGNGAAFQPNFYLEVTPDFLDQSIRQLKADGYRFLPLEAVPEALAQPAGQPFAAFTLDDGYRDNAEHALPVFARHGVPFTVFVTGGFIDRTHSLWWETADALLGASQRLAFDFGSGPEELDLTDLSAKYEAYTRIGHFIQRRNEADQIAVLNRIALEAGVDPLEITARLTMDEDEIAAFAAHPLVSLGAHTISHRALARLDPDNARREMQASAARVEEITGRRPRAIAYPYGNGGAACARDFSIAADLGFTVGVTTRPGVLTGQHSATGLPRVSLNGFYQKRRYVSALASGIPFTFRGADRI